MTQSSVTSRAPEQPPEAALEAAIAYAILAPSGHNTQPWLFKICREWLEVCADRRRALPVVDPQDRALTISCGAALFNLWIALRHFGYSVSVERLAAEGSDLLARVRCGEPRPATSDEERLFQAIPRRRTNRRPFEARALPVELIEELRQSANSGGVSLATIGEKARDAVADLIAEGDRIQAADAGFRKELAAWVHSGRRRDGIPTHAFGVPALASLIFPSILRTFDWGNGQAAKDRQLAAGSPILAVLATSSDTPAAWLQAGQSLEGLLLTATANGLSASFLNQPIEVPSLRQKLATLAGGAGYPQILLRLGYGPEVKSTPRRELDDVVVRE